MLDISEMATWAGWIMTIIGLVGFVIHPILSSFTKISSNLTKISHNLDLISRDLEASKSDRLAIHNELAKHDERLDRQGDKIIEHSEQIKTLFKEVQ